MEMILRINITYYSLLDLIIYYYIHMDKAPLHRRIQLY